MLRKEEYQEYLAVGWESLEEKVHCNQLHLGICNDEGSDETPSM